MLQEDLEKLSKPYPSSDHTSKRDRFAESLGVEILPILDLAQYIFEDLSVDNYGIGWWKDHKKIGIKKRIFISDYLFQATQSIHTNLKEAKLHLILLSKSSKEQNDFIKNGFCIPSGQKPIFTHPPRLRPLDDLHSELCDLHVAGFLRALGSAFDCLSSTIIGVLGLEMNILKADLGSLQVYLDKKSKNSNEIEKSFADFFFSTLYSSGPEDWFAWSNDYRNMVVHRGRRLVYNQLIPKPRKSLALKKPIFLTEAISMLPRDPSKTEIEILLDNAFEFVLTEKAETTFEGLIKSTVGFIDIIASELIKIWLIRRNQPLLIEQPSKQWILNRTRRVNFKGYSPNSVPFKADKIIGNPIMLKRMKSACLDSSEIHKWKEFSEH